MKSIAFFRQRTSKLQLSIGQMEGLSVVALLLLAFFLRLHGITSQPTDWHAFRQADTASVTREYVKHGIDILHPTYQDNSNIQSGKENPLGYRMVEFPIVNAGIAALLRALPSLDLSTTSRVVSVLFSVGVVFFLWVIGKRWSGGEAGLLAAFTFAILPYARYYSRAILPEMPLVFFMTATVVCFDLWIETKQWRWYLTTTIVFALALLMKPFAFFILPVFLVMAWQGFGRKFWQHLPLLLLLLIASSTPLIWWRQWITNFPEGIPASDWLFNSDHIRWRPAWFRWLGWERFTKMLLGVAAIPLFLAGLWPQGRAWPKYWAWWLGMVAYMSIIATGNVRHDYYQVITLPILCLTIGAGGIAMLNWSVPHTRQWQRAGVVLALLITAACFSDRFIAPYYRTRPDWEIAGQAADQILPADAKVIAPAFGDTAFLFQTNRTGWPIGFEIEDKRAKGAQYYVTTSDDDEARMLAAQYPTIARTADYIIIDLRQPLGSITVTQPNQGEQ